MVTQDQGLPNDAQREAIAEMIQLAFVEIRALSNAGCSSQASALADAFHNLPREVYGWGTWKASLTRAILVDYQDKHHQEDYGARFDYVAMFDRIFPRG